MLTYLQRFSTDTGATRCIKVTSIYHDTDVSSCVSLSSEVSDSSRRCIHSSIRYANRHALSRSLRRQDILLLARRKSNTAATTPLTFAYLTSTKPKKSTAPSSWTILNVPSSTFLQESTVLQLLRTRRTFLQLMKVKWY
jgi:hypothetical protein